MKKNTNPPAHDPLAHAGPSRADVAAPNAGAPSWEQTPSDVLDEQREAAHQAASHSREEAEDFAGEAQKRANKAAEETTDRRPRQR
jgi:hypothetical protein